MCDTWLTGLIIGVGLGCIPAALGLVLFVIAHQSVCRWCRGLDQR